MIIDKLLYKMGLVRASQISSIRLRAARHTPPSGTAWVDVKFPDGKVQRLMMGMSFVDPVRREDITICDGPSALPPQETP